MLSGSNLENWKAALSLRETFGEWRRMAAPGRVRVHATVGCLAGHSNCGCGKDVRWRENS